MRPILFTLGGLAIPAYATFLTLALLLSWPLTLGSAGDAPIVETLLGLLGTTAGSILGARLLHEAVNPRASGERRQWLRFDGGMMAMGGFLGGALGAVLLVSARGGDVLGFFDAGAPAMALGLAVARVGCLLKGCDFGRPLSSLSRLPGIRFPSWRARYPGLREAGSPAYLEHLRQGLVGSQATQSARCHPVQLYWSAAGLLTLGWLLATPQPGRFLRFMFAYSVLSFGLELLRGDRDRGAWRGLSTTQWLSIPIACGSASALVWG